MSKAKELPIIFSNPMVRAILDGRKMQTRLVLHRIAGIGPITEFAASETPGYDWTFRCKRMLWHDLNVGELLGRCPYGKPGDRLWVREMFCPCGCSEHCVEHIAYRADDFLPPRSQWRPSIHMPRKLSRITLEVTGVRVERVQEISESDAFAEGITHDGTWWRGGIHPVKGSLQCWPTAKRAFQATWDSLHAKPKPQYVDGEIVSYSAYPFGEHSYGDTWRGKPLHVVSNPWVWVVEFKRIKP